MVIRPAASFVTLAPCPSSIAALARMGDAEATSRFLLAVAVVLVAARVTGSLAARLRQPRVIGEIIAGIVLGPSLLGLLAPHAAEWLLGGAVVQRLAPVADLGLVLFMFLVGLELDVGHLRGAGRKALAISWTSIVAPFAFAVPLAVWLHPRLGARTGRLSFVVFLGAAMAITAFPVLARILRDRNLSTSRIGALVITCAAVDDVTAWFLLAVAGAVAGSGTAADVLGIVLLVAAFAAVALGVVRPVLARLPSLSPPLAVALALGCAWVTEIIGVHALFGAFVAGILVPRTPTVRAALDDTLGTVAETVLLPVFFVKVGLSTRVDLMDSAYLGAIALVVVLTAVAGKFGGSAVAARLTGESWRDAATIGTLMNTRGLTEIVILTVGLDLGVIGPELFTIMVIMALVTTVMAGPLLSVLLAGDDQTRDDLVRRATSLAPRRRVPPRFAKRRS